MRLIDADALEANIMMEAPACMGFGSSITKAFIMAMIKTRSVTPTVDAVPVVRCRDCKRRGTYDCPVYVGGDGMCSEPDDWFCADGVPKEGR